MSILLPHWRSPVHYLKSKQPDLPVLFFDPEVLLKRINLFQTQFPGLTTYAVKANPDDSVISYMVASGLQSFDVASPQEMQLIKQHYPKAVLHYHNPARSVSEINAAVECGVKSYSVDSLTGLMKLANSVSRNDTEVSVRFKLPVSGASYDFGSKFGLTPSKAVELLKQVVSLGFSPSLTFHPGTQCKDPTAWEAYITIAAEISAKAATPLYRLNVGGGFPSHRNGDAPDLSAYFEVIAKAVAFAFPTSPPKLVCEPGRAMVAEAFSLATRVKAINDQGDIYLNDGKYGGMADFADMNISNRFSVVAPDGRIKSDPVTERKLFGPTCDSLDVMPGRLSLPHDIQEEDYIVFKGMGAYSNGMTTRFNGYGILEIIQVESLQAD